MSFLSFLNPFGGGDSKSSVSTNAPTTNTRNQNIQSNAAPTNTDGGTQFVTTTVTDQGAIANSLAVVNGATGAALDTVRSGNAAALDTVRSGNAAALDTVRSGNAAALSFAGKSLGDVLQNNTDLAHADAALTLGVIKQYTDANAAAFNKSIDSATAQNNSLKDFVQKVTQSDSQAISQNLIKYGAYVAIGVAALMIFGRK